MIFAITALLTVLLYCANEKRSAFLVAVWGNYLHVLYLVFTGPDEAIGAWAITFFLFVLVRHHLSFVKHFLPKEV